MLKIRLMRIGTKKKPFYRVVAVDERNKRTGGYIELLGTYNPLTEPKEIKLKQDRIDHWVKQGAQMSVGFLRIIGKAPQRLPRKPKKQKQESSNTNQAKELKAEEKEELTKVESEESSEDQIKSDKSETSESVAQEESGPTDQADTQISSDTPNEEAKDEGSA